MFFYMDSYHTARQAASARKTTATIGGMEARAFETAVVGTGVACSTPIMPVFPIHALPLGALNASHVVPLASSGKHIEKEVHTSRHIFGRSPFQLQNENISCCRPS
jgi:hypothetical protein